MRVGLVTQWEAGETALAYVSNLVIGIMKMLGEDRQISCELSPMVILSRKGRDGCEEGAIIFIRGYRLPFNILILV